MWCLYDPFFNFGLLAELNLFPGTFSMRREAAGKYPWWLRPDRSLLHSAWHVSMSLQLKVGKYAGKWGGVQSVTWLITVHLVHVSLLWTHRNTVLFKSDTTAAEVIKPADFHSWSWWSQTAVKESEIKGGRALWWQPRSLWCFMRIVRNVA